MSKGKQYRQLAIQKLYLEKQTQLYFQKIPLRIYFSKREVLSPICVMREHALGRCYLVTKYPWPLVNDL